MYFNKKAQKAGIIILCLFLTFTVFFIKKEMKDNHYINTFNNDSISVLSEKLLVVGGHSVGVKMDVKGVLIVGLEEIETANNGFVNPGIEAGLEVGDTIISVNDIKVFRAKEVQTLVNENKDNVVLKIQRKNDIFEINLKPVKAKFDGMYKLGIWVKDKTAGIGTLTFYDPETGNFGALGHGITDPETGTIFKVADGELVNSRVQSVKEGKAGNPGEIRGIFYEAEAPIGELYSNTLYGIFGKAYKDIKNPYYDKPLAVGGKDSVKLGTAFILTTLKENEIKMYEIEIENIDYNNKMNGTKNMTIKVTDKELLKKSGGIVQGMSGSPIIQNGKIIGAVTHVFVNNPAKGYGIFIENMLDTAEKIGQK